MKKRGMVLESLGWWLLALALFILLVFGIVLLTKSGGGAIEYIKNLFRFGR